MAARRSDEQRIKDMAMYINETEIRLDLYPITAAQFINRDDWQSKGLGESIEVAVYKTLEEANNLSESVTSQNRNIPWEKLRGMRNIFAHGYHDIDHKIILDTIVNDFPDLREFCEDYAQEKGFEIEPRYLPSKTLKQEREHVTQTKVSRQASFADKLDLINNSLHSSQQRGISREDFPYGQKRAR